jgi:hypothetical protein
MCPGPGLLVVISMLISLHGLIVCSPQQSRPAQTLSAKTFNLGKLNVWNDTMVQDVFNLELELRCDPHLYRPINAKAQLRNASIANVGRPEYCRFCTDVCC